MEREVEFIVKIDGQKVGYKIIFVDDKDQKTLQNVFNVLGECVLGLRGKLRELIVDGKLVDDLRIKED